MDALPKLLKRHDNTAYGLWVNLDSNYYYEEQRILLVGNNYDEIWVPFEVVYEDESGETKNDSIVPMKIGNTLFVYENFGSDTFQPLVPYQESQNGLRVEYYTSDEQGNPVPHPLQPGETTLLADAFNYINIFPDENNSNGFVQDDSYPISGRQNPIDDTYQVTIGPDGTASFNTILIDYVNKTLCAHRYTVTLLSD